MFYYRIVVKTKNGNRISRMAHYREYLKTSEVGEAVAGFLNGRSVTGVTVARIDQAAYRRMSTLDAAEGDGRR